MSPTPHVDLQDVARRESEQVEWKAEVADLDDVVRTIAAFANDFANLGGGYVVCGASEARDEHGFQHLRATGLSAGRARELEPRILAACRDRIDPPVVPLVEELPADDPSRRVLVFIVAATGRPHLARVGNEPGRYYVRLGRETREARNGLLRDLLVRRGAVEPWDRRPCPTATVADLDLLALRDVLGRLNLPDPEALTPRLLSADERLHALVPPLLAREPLTGTLRPRHFALLLFGRAPTHAVPGAHTIFSRYPGVDRSDAHAERHELDRSLLAQADRVLHLLDAQTWQAIDKTDPRTPNALKYPPRALHEAAINALAHRDYEATEPTRITVFADRVEFRSPGGLPHGVDPVAFQRGESGPLWRNQTLAWFLGRLHLAQAEGQGIPTILKTMHAEGCPPPRFDVTPTEVRCVLPAHPRTVGW